MPYGFTKNQEPFSYIRDVDRLTSYKIAQKHYKIKNKSMKTEWTIKIVDVGTFTRDVFIFRRILGSTEFIQNDGTAFLLQRVQQNNQNQ